MRTYGVKVRFNVMQFGWGSRIVCMLLFIGMMQSLSAETIITQAKQSTVPETSNLLSQQQYDQLIQQYTDQVNATKQILDSDDADQEPQALRQAFCTRMQAYHQIQAISKQNPQLDGASTMLLVATHFLDRQQQSMQASGMTEQFFCKSAHSP